MHNLRKIGLMLIGLLAISTICVFVVSCQEEEEKDNISLNDEQPTSSFMSSLGTNVDSFMNTPIVLNESDNSTNTNTRTQNVVLTRNLYVDLSYVDTSVTLESIKTPGQILNLVKTTGADISLINDGTYTHTLTISEEDCLSALNPLIIDSKQYLYGKGFTESEIQTMLKENNVDESALVPFVLSLTEEEVYQQSNAITSTAANSVDLDRVGRCAVHALGFDALAGLAQSTAKTWSKAVLKTVFKTVAAKMVGPVGVSIAIIDFSLCYWG